MEIEFELEDNMDWVVSYYWLVELANKSGKPDVVKFFEDLKPLIEAELEGDNENPS